MNKSYYLLNGKIKTGPFKLEDLKSMVITEKFMVWTEGMADWKNALEITELEGTITKTPELPPPTPNEILKIKNKKALIQASKEATLCFFILGTLIFLIAGGFSSDEKIKELYPDYGADAIYAEADEIRFEILPALSYLFISLPISLLLLFFRYKHFRKEFNTQPKVKDTEIA